MSDRVAIIGGSEIGRDHFPVGLFGFSAATNWTLGSQPYAWYMPIQDACYAFYVVRRWYIGIDIHYTLGDPGPGQTTHYVSISFEFEWNIFYGLGLTSYKLPTHESDLVCFRFGYSTPWNDRVDGGNTIDDDPTAYPNFTVYNYNSTAHSDLTGIDLTYEFSLFTPNPKFDGQVVVEYHFQVYDSNGFGAGDGVGTNVIGSFNANMGSGLYSSTSQDITNQPIAGTNRIQITSAKVIISPNSVSSTTNRFWPYAARNGSPIWNYRFGNQLQSPFN